MVDSAQGWYLLGLILTPTAIRAPWIVIAKRFISAGSLRDVAPDGDVVAEEWRFGARADVSKARAERAKPETPIRTLPLAGLDTHERICFQTRR